MRRWTGRELGELTVVAHGERETWSALDGKTRLRRAPLAEGDAHSVTAILRAVRAVASREITSVEARPSLTRVRAPLRSARTALSRKRELA